MAGGWQGGRGVVARVCVTAAAATRVDRREDIRSCEMYQSIEGKKKEFTRIVSYGRYKIKVVERESVKRNQRPLFLYNGLIP